MIVTLNLNAFAAGLVTGVATYHIVRDLVRLAARWWR